jgi:hypothetical protein
MNSHRALLTVSALASTKHYRSIVAPVVAAAALLPKSRRGPDYKRFLNTYYGNVDTEGMSARSPAALAAAALSHLQFARIRRGGALVRVWRVSIS